VLVLRLFQDHAEHGEVRAPRVLEHGADGVCILNLDVGSVAAAARKLYLTAHHDVLRLLRQQLLLALLTVRVR